MMKKMSDVTCALGTSHPNPFPRPVVALPRIGADALPRRVAPPDSELYLAYLVKLTYLVKPDSELYLSCLSRKVIRTNAVLWRRLFSLRVSQRFYPQCFGCSSK